MATSKKTQPKAKATRKPRPKAKATKAKAPPKRKPLIEAPSTKELVNQEKKRLFLQGLTNYGTIRKAAEFAELSRTTYYLWTDPKIAEAFDLDPTRHYDPEFQAACVKALTVFNEKVLDTGYDRAVNGWIDEKYDRNGVLMAREHKYDSSILQMLMKKADPELKDKPPSVSVDARHQSVNFVEGEQPLDNMTPEQKRLLLQIVRLERQKEDPSPQVLEGELIEHDETNSQKE